MMKNVFQALHLFTSLSLFLARFLSLASYDSAGDVLPLSDYWSSPQFIKKFTATYGVNSAIEPTISSEEKALFDELVPLIRADINTAIATLQARLTSQSSAALDFTLGNLYFEIGRYHEATQQYLVALEKFPNFRRAYNLLGKVNGRMGDFGAAIPYLVKTIELGGGDGDTYGLLGYCYLHTKQFYSAQTAYTQALLYAPESVDWQLGQAQCLLFLQKWEEAVGLFEELLSRQPDRPEYWLLQANAYLALGEPLQAAANYEILRRMKKTTPESLFQLGDIYLNHHLLHLAYPIYLEALETHPQEQPDRSLRVAEILTARAAWEEASQYLSSIRQTYEGHLSRESELQLLTLEGRIALAMSEDDKALKTLKTIIERDPMNGEALLLIARLQGSKDQIAEAIFYYETVRQIEAFKVDALLGQAQLYVSQREYDKAMPLLREAQEIDPREHVDQYLEEVERAVRSTGLNE